MTTLRGSLRALCLAALSMRASASFIRQSVLLERADDTCAPNFLRCTQPDLPGNFCCESTATCLLLAGNTTVACCPKGKSCDKISTITCDLSLQDPALNPVAEIKTTALTGTLDPCAGNCCPFGYHCNGTACIINDDQSKKPATRPPTTSSTIAPSSTESTPTQASTTVVVSGISSAAPSTETPAASTDNTSNTVTIVGGVIGGVVALVLIISVITLMCYRRKERAKKKDLAQRHESTSSFGNIISAPVPHANFPSQRLDFLAKGGGSSSSQASSPTAVGTATLRTRDRGEVSGHWQDEDRFMPPNSPYSPYARRPDSAMSDAPRSYHASAEVGGLRSLTHWNTPPQFDEHVNNGAPRINITGIDGEERGRTRDRRQDSAGSESINIFADPNTMAAGAAGRPASTATTWSNIQQRADHPRNTGAGQGQGQWLGDELTRRR
ncbi:hypothetical protein F4677DRAFT_178480 [Hypoxylon crocopeplum]|nr:hypothetical protein F4677DRAFT_178480 [Hypoxylon crocopeplum]